MFEVPVEPLPKEAVVDTNGAGDSFVGAFLSSIYQGHSIEVSINHGNHLARECVQRSGCTFPDHLKF